VLRDEIGPEDVEEDGQLREDLRALKIRKPPALWAAVKCWGCSPVAICPS
jgi:hypothetical protein